ncbi:MAG TPA: porin [Polyangiaceae bacterium]|nr:porin [Polyangiaceae bacterium]
MSIRQRALSCAATLVVSALSPVLAHAADPKAPPAPAATPAKPAAAAAVTKLAAGPAAPGKPAAAEPAKPAAEVAKPKPKARPVAASPPAAKPAAPPEPAAEAARLQRIEASLRAAGLLGPSEDTRQKELADLKAQQQKLDEQRANLEQAVKQGLDDAAVKGVLAQLEQKSADNEQRIAALEAAGSGSATPAPLLERLQSLEASVAELQAQRTEKPAASEAAPPAPVLVPPPAQTQAEPGRDAKPVGRAGFKDGFFIESADGAYSLRPQSFLDFKFAYAGLAGKDDEFALSVPYARIALKGTLFTKSFKYNVTTDFAKGNAVLTYYWGDYLVAPDFFAVRAGQQKRPFSRLYIGPSEKGQFVSAAAAVKAFGDATDIGVVLHNGQPAFEYAVGIFNGTTSKSNFAGQVQVDTMTGKGSVSGGAFSNVPARFRPAFVARVAANYGKIEGYSETDFEGGGFRASLGLASYIELDYDKDDKSAVRGTIDGLIKYEGLAVNVAGFIGSKQDGTHWGDRALEGTGGVVQVGYLVTEHVEPIARYSFVSPKGSNNDTHELTGGVNLYLYKHNLKWMNDVGASIRPEVGKTTTDYIYESQLQMMF